MFHYFDSNGTKQGPCNGAQLKTLAKNGSITPDTLVESEDGRQTKAKNIRGLFPPPVPPPIRPQQHFDTVSPDNPFITPQPESKTETSSTKNPSINPPSAVLQWTCPHCGEPLPADTGLSAVSQWVCPHCGEPVSAGEKFCGSAIEPELNEYVVAQYRYSSDTEVMPIFQLLTDSSFRELLPEALFLWITKIYYAIALVAVILCTFCSCGSIIFMAVGTSTDSPANLLTILVVPFICIGSFLAICMLRLSCEWGIITFHYVIIWTIEFLKLPKAIRIFLEAKSKRE